MEKLDYKKAFPALYAPKSTPAVVDVPEMVFLQVDGKGNPNDVNGEYQHAIELLYGLAYAIKMSPKGGNTPKDYFEYVVPPLEGLWWFGEGATRNVMNKNDFCWTAMIRQPEFVTEEVVQAAKQAVQKKKPQLDTAKARLAAFKEGLCVQCLHSGPFDEEPATVEKMEQFMEQNHLICDLSETRRHHEIYLSDPRKTEPSKWKTVLRHPVKRQK